MIGYAVRRGGRCWDRLMYEKYNNHPQKDEIFKILGLQNEESKNERK